MKKKLKRILYWISNRICDLFPMKKEILFESHPDCTCNSYELYRYCIEQGLNREFRLTWIVEEPERFHLKEENVGMLPYPKSFREKLLFYFRCNRAWVLLSSNRHIPKYRVAKKQLNIYLDHGSQLKSLKNYNADGSRYRLYCDYLICQSEFFVPYNISEYQLTKDQIVCTGLPRNDQLFRRYNSAGRLIPDRENYEKIILWTPTFRMHKKLTRNDCNRDYPLGLPVLNTEEDARAMNDTLMKHRVLMIIKPHPAQYMGVMKEMRLSNVMFLYNNELAQHDIQLNELMAQTDAMITDYSSIYWDYLLLHRPLALTLDDFEDYSRDNGFVFEDPLEVLKGARIYTLEDLNTFIRDVAAGTDTAKDEREATCAMVHQYQDADSSARVYEFMIREARRRFGD